jgi:hypothetical protein
VGWTFTSTARGSISRLEKSELRNALRKHCHSPEINEREGTFRQDAGINGFYAPLHARRFNQSICADGIVDAVRDKWISIRLMKSKKIVFLD